MSKEVAWCVRCGEETQLHVCFAPLCIRCDEERSRETIEQTKIAIRDNKKAVAEDAYKHRE
jgi:hypothetical protein